MYLANGFLPPEPILCVSIDFVLCSGERGIQTLCLRKKYQYINLKILHHKSKSCIESYTGIIKKLYLNYQN